MRRRRDSRDGQLQVLESIIVAIFLFLAIVVLSIYRLPSNPGSFQQAELLRLGEDALKVRAAKAPSVGADCNETPCPFANDLERMLSLALGYVGATVGPQAGPEPLNEAPNSTDLKSFIDQALPDGTRYIFHYSNGFNTTKLFPTNLDPPSSSVVVARNLQGPNWAVYAGQRDASVLLRVGENTTFAAALATVPTIDQVRDPLNRDRTEWGYLNKDQYSTTVPNNATLGTHEVRLSGAGTPPTTRYFTVVPRGTHGAGSQILPFDPPAVPTLNKTFGGFLSKVKWYNTGGPGWGDNDRLYLDSDDPASPAVVSMGDLRLGEVGPPGPACRLGVATCYSGSYVYSGDSDLGRALDPLPGAGTVRWHNLDGAGATYTEGDTVYYDPDGVGSVAAGDLRLSRVGLYRAGSFVVAGDVDIGHALAAAPFAGAQVVFDDVNLNLRPNAMEAVFLDFQDPPQTGDLDAYDLHLTPIGAPASRYFYDIKVAIWYGV